MWLLEDRKAPDHATLARFRSEWKDGQLISRNPVPQAGRLAAGRGHPLVKQFHCSV